MLINEQLQNKPFVIVSEQEIYEHLVYIRLRGYFPLSCTAEKSSYDEAILNLRNSATTGNLVFNIPKKPIYLLGTETEIQNNLIGTSGNPSVGDLCNNSSDEDNNERKRKTNSYIEPLCILDVTIFRKVTKEFIGSNDKEHAPICIVTKKRRDTAYIPLKIDVLSLISKQTSINRLYNILVESIVKNLKAFHLTVLQNLEETNKLILPEVHHFYPKECGHFISIWMPQNVDQSRLESSRRSLHEQFYYQ
ncbi:hypothetical protein HHI36_011655 [Cryptolaemus montrouzieri]|uniref:UFSP2 second domain-containing protein n=1 Tax=Cryptolaemus montrouzieri TaxID=559131 RepID=A0ABD2MMI6_9CUCU